MLERLNQKQKAIHQRALYLSRRHRALEAELVATLQDVADEQIHKRLEYTSLVKYAVDALGLSEAVAVAFVTVAHKSTQVEALASAIQQGELTVSTASRMTSAISPENARELIDFAKSHTHRELNLKIASINPQKTKRVHVKAVSGDRVRMSLDMPTTLLEMIERAQDLLSTGTACDKLKAMEVVFAEWLESKDPVKKAERAKIREFKRSRRATEWIATASVDSKSCSNRVSKQAISVETKPASRKPTYERTRIPAAIKHAVTLRDGHQCTFVDHSGCRCGNRRWIDIHHIKPVSQGGANDLENLTTLCSAHHDLIHQLSLPIEGQFNWIREPMRAYTVIAIGS